MPDPVPAPRDFLNAETICSYLHKNLQIQFQIEGTEMREERALLHFQHRKALSIVQSLLIDAAERAAKTQPSL